MVLNKRAKILTGMLPLAFMLIAFGFCKFINFFNNKSDAVYNNSAVKSSETDQTTSQNSTCSLNDMRGLWVPFMDLEINSDENVQEKFEAKFKEIITQAKNHKINTLIVHVRSHSDAFYPSKLFPMSHIFTGNQGSKLSFNPLKYMIDEAHKNRLKFHAWINPLRIKSKTSPKQLSQNNPYFRLNSENYTIIHTGGICYNPGFEETQNLIVDGIKEIVENYSVDGIHFDDYFYPEKKDTLSPDKAFEKYIQTEKNPITELEWRKKSINDLISKTYKTIKQINPYIQFGISPPGIISKCYDEGADVKLWTSQDGYLDYICPQLYWSIDFKEMPFEKAATNWKNIIKNPKIKLYSGLAIYKIGTDCDKNTWKNQNDIIKKEINILKNLRYDGFALYSSKYLNLPETKEELTNFLSVI